MIAFEKMDGLKRNRPMMRREGERRDSEVSQRKVYLSAEQCDRWRPQSWLCSPCRTKRKYGSHGRSGSHKECAFQAGYVARLVELCCKDADQQSVRDCGLVPMGGVALFAQGELYVHSEQTR